MPFSLIFYPEAQEQLDALDNNPAQLKRSKAVKKALAYLSANPRHPSLNTHEITFLSRIHGQKVFEAYVENHTPGAYRVFWKYGAEKIKSLKKEKKDFQGNEILNEQISNHTIEIISIREHL